MDDFKKDEDKKAGSIPLIFLPRVIYLGRLGARRFIKKADSQLKILQSVFLDDFLFGFMKDIIFLSDFNEGIQSFLQMVHFMSGR